MSASKYVTQMSASKDVLVVELFEHSLSTLSAVVAHRFQTLYSK